MSLPQVCIELTRGVARAARRAPRPRRAVGPASGAAALAKPKAKAAAPLLVCRVLGPIALLGAVGSVPALVGGVPPAPTPPPAAARTGGAAAPAASAFLGPGLLPLGPAGTGGGGPGERDPAALVPRGPGLLADLPLEEPPRTSPERPPTPPGETGPAPPPPERRDTPIPEPSALLLLLAALGGWWALRRPA